MTTLRPSAPSVSDVDPGGAQISALPDQDVQRQTLPAIAPDMLPPMSDRPSVLKFGSGRSIHAKEEGNEEQIEIRAPGGALLLSMRLTADGPVLSLTAASLEIAAAKTLSLRAETLRIAAEKDISIQAGGALVERSGADTTREVGGAYRVRAGEIESTAHPGGISLRANDDVDIVGERVRLNSDDPPMPQTWEEHRSRHALVIEPGALEPPPVELAAESPVTAESRPSSSS